MMWRREKETGSLALGLYRFYCPHCGAWQTYGQTPFCPYCGQAVEKNPDYEWHWGSGHNAENDASMSQ